MTTIAARESESSRLSAEGRLVVPASVRKALGWKPGESVSFRVEQDGVMLTSRESARAKLKRMFQDAVPPGVSLADELIAERRAEFLKELEES
jgi:AbrB family looped-hinge helix DNA binding protein